MVLPCCRQGLNLRLPSLHHYTYGFAFVRWAIPHRGPFANRRAPPGPRARLLGVGFTAGEVSFAAGEDFFRSPIGLCPHWFGFQHSPQDFVAYHVD
jgi:hypothetical protein